jgi:hypothetical protein
MQQAEQGKNIVVDFEEIEAIAVKPVKIQYDQYGKDAQGKEIAGFPGEDALALGEISMCRHKFTGIVSIGRTRWVSGYFRKID